MSKNKKEDNPFVEKTTIKKVQIVKPVKLLMTEKRNPFQ